MRPQPLITWLKVGRRLWRDNRPIKVKGEIVFVDASKVALARAGNEDVPELVYLASAAGLTGHLCLDCVDHVHKLIVIAGREKRYLSAAHAIHKPNFVPTLA